MPRWNNSLKDNCIQVMDSVIKNLNPKLYQRLLEKMLSINLENNKKVIERFVRDELTLTSTLSKNSVGYWKSRGWTDNESYVKAQENKQKNCKSVYSREFWLEKTNPVTNLGYTIEEADFERNSRRPIRKEYWIKKGHTEADAIMLAEDSKVRNNKKGAEKSAVSTVRNVSSKRCKEYYTARGYSKIEATELVAAGQKYFSKKICIEKYGTVEGLNRWQERQDRWQEKLKNKPPEEIARINRLKLTKGITVSAAEIKILQGIKKLGLTTPVKDQLTLFKNNKKQYVYDIAVDKKIIEYNGDFWHCNPKKYSPDYINPRTKLAASEKWKLDQEKIKFAEDQGYQVLVVWESDFKKNQEEVLNKCIQFLTQ